MLNLLSMSVKLKNGRWTAICSDDQPDLAGDTATVELFNNFIKRARAANKPPYLSLAHYFAMDVPEHLQSKLGQYGVPGWADTLMVSDGKLVAAGKFDDSQLGQKTMMAIANDQVEGSDHQTRISIGFTDLEHAHGPIRFVRRSWEQKCPLCVKGHPRTFIDGELVHLAVTRVPVNPRTGVELEDKSMAAAIATMKDDAESIVGDKLTEALEAVNNKQPEMKSEVVRKSETPSITLDDIRGVVQQMLTDAVTELKSAVTTPATESQNSNEYGTAFNELTTQLSGVATIQQAEEALASFGEKVKAHVTKSLPPVTPPPPEIAQMMGLMQQMAQNINSVTTQVTDLAQQVNTVSAVVARSQMPMQYPAMRQPQPITVDNPSATNGTPQTEPKDALRIMVEKSVGLRQ